MAAKRIFAHSFWFDSDNVQTTGALQVAFDVVIYNKYTYSLCI
jgi:hypothetical protein